MKSAVPKGQASCVTQGGGGSPFASKPGRVVASTWLFLTSLLTHRGSCGDSLDPGRKKKKKKQVRKGASNAAGSLSPGCHCWGCEQRDGVGVLGHSLLLASRLQRSPENPRHRETGIDPSKGLRTRTATGSRPRTALLKPYQSKTGIRVAEFESRPPTLTRSVSVFSVAADWPCVSVFPSVKEKGCRSQSRRILLP